MNVRYRWLAYLLTFLLPFGPLFTYGRKPTCRPGCPCGDPTLCGTVSPEDL